MIFPGGSRCRRFLFCFWVWRRFWIVPMEYVYLRVELFVDEEGRELYG